jgi:hypothetical protein
MFTPKNLSNPLNQRTVLVPRAICWRRRTNLVEAIPRNPNIPSHAEGEREEEQGHQPPKNTCLHCKKIQRRKPHHINSDKCTWKKKYKGYHFKSICNEIELAFKPHNNFLAEFGGYAEAINGAQGQRMIGRMTMTGG